MTYIPDRNDLVLLDFDPTKGKEIGKYRPALVLSSKAYSKATGLLICCPISTSIRNTPTGNRSFPYIIKQQLAQASAVI